MWWQWVPLQHSHKPILHSHLFMIFVFCYVQCCQERQGRAADPPYSEAHGMQCTVHIKPSFHSIVDPQNKINDPHSPRSPRDYCGTSACLYSRLFLPLLSGTGNSCMKSTIVSNIILIDCIFCYLVPLRPLAVLSQVSMADTHSNRSPSHCAETCLNLCLSIYLS